MAISKDEFQRLRSLRDCGQPITELLAGAEVAPVMFDGLVRFFTRQNEECPIRWWNEVSTWKSEWNVDFGNMVAIGEDIFGNQFVVNRESGVVQLWNHETGERTSLFDLDPIDFIEAVSGSGLEWLDAYDPVALRVAEDLAVTIGRDSHLHWVQPLSLGGSVDQSNTAPVPRREHLRGHGKLWRQIQGVQPGALLIPKKP